MTDYACQPADIAANRVVYVLEVANRAGIMNAVAAVFADRGLSVGGVYADTRNKPTRVLIEFCGTARQRRMVAQVLCRLHDVHNVRTLPEDAPELCAVAICRLSGALPALERVSTEQTAAGWVLSGSFTAVEQALVQLEQAGLLQSASRALLAL